jgi:hypothetical protein
MPNQARIQSRVYRGYEKAAQKLGSPYDIYRPNGLVNPLAAGNKVGTLLAVFPAEATYTFKTTQKPNDPYAYALDDGRLTRPGDYLTNGQKTYFVASQHPIQSILCVTCDALVSFASTRADGQAGVNPYGGRTEATDVPVLTNWPALLRVQSGGTRTEANLPGDARSPWWQVLLPPGPTFLMHNGDEMTDNLGRRFIVSSHQITEFGHTFIVDQAES